MSATAETTAHAANVADLQTIAAARLEECEADFLKLVAVDGITPVQAYRAGRMLDELLQMTGAQQVMAG